LYGRASNRKNRLGGNPLQFAAAKYRTRPGGNDEYVPISEHAAGKYAGVTIGVTIDDNCFDESGLSFATIACAFKVNSLARVGDEWPTKKSTTLRSCCKHLHVFRRFIFITQFVTDKSRNSLNHRSAS
jgi:hypothetical protein